jgi:hypothetical protein
VRYARDAVLGSVIADGTEVARSGEMTAIHAFNDQLV